ncbi:Aldo/keto reductase [Tilletiaria anomala UBC 951]|uniref:Aldo/keto reductase n=1 Tax=Tilletiaria anomala (strain ATCC 24038 / CBS 436.72 / UBC 951) TaxID=1037660 RepID=A0A066VXB6_TILAU|nr:Aldo/keto reductase [Tilletiaria anomala UBC 951]KDN43195.1 Aldo/keto reductase [Tilletiaria anomala UBC 951]
MNIQVRNFSISGLRHSYGDQVGLKATEKIIKAASENGIYTFDAAEMYTAGQSETGHMLGHQGTCRKLIIEAADQSLERCGLKYWSVIHAHQADASHIQEAHTVAARLDLIVLVTDQRQYSWLYREHVEKEFGLTLWSPIASGVLTGKYNVGIFEGLRIATNQAFIIDGGKAKIENVMQLIHFAKELGTCHRPCGGGAKYPNVSIVILAATNPQQVFKNLKALDVLPKLLPEIMEWIGRIVQNRPRAKPTFKG